MQEINTNTNGNGSTSAIRKVLQNEVAQVVAIAVAVYGLIAMVILPLQRNTQDIDTIRTNHLEHIQDAIEEIKATDKNQDQRIQEIDKKLERILTILEQQDTNK